MHLLGFSHYYFKKLQMPQGGNQPIHTKALLWALKMCANASPWGWSKNYVLKKEWNPQCLNVDGQNNIFLTAYIISSSRNVTLRLYILPYLLSCLPNGHDALLSFCLTSCVLHLSVIIWLGFQSGKLLSQPLQPSTWHLPGSCLQVAPTLLTYPVFNASCASNLKMV